MPDEYYENWKTFSLGEYWDWWHLGYEDGYAKAKFDYGLSADPVCEVSESEKIYAEIERLRNVNSTLHDLIATNYRVMKKEIEKSVREENSQQSEKTES